MSTATTSTRRLWILGSACGAVALAALVAGSAWGAVNPPRTPSGATPLDPRLIAWISAAVLLVFGAVATTRVARALARSVATGPVPSAGGAVRILASGVGYLVVVFAVLAVLSVSIERILVGAGLAGVVLGIAAQQSLGNVFAGVVLVLARPFNIGDHVRVRSGALGGVFEAWVREMSLTYVTLELGTGEMKIPNSAMLAAGVGRMPPGAPWPPATEPPPPSQPPQTPSESSPPSQAPDSSVG
ncbi:MAG: mechanosensitive ion channel domain-containing protein [Acidimicrobiales bacterium]